MMKKKKRLNYYILSPLTYFFFFNFANSIFTKKKKKLYGDRIFNLNISNHNSTQSELQRTILTPDSGFEKLNIFKQLPRGS